MEEHKVTATKKAKGYAYHSAQCVCGCECFRGEDELRARAERAERERDECSLACDELRANLEGWKDNVCVLEAALAEARRERDVLRKQLRVLSDEQTFMSARAQDTRARARALLARLDEKETK